MPSFHGCAAAPAMLKVTSVQVKQQYLRWLGCNYLQALLVRQRYCITGLQRVVVELDFPFGHMQPGMAGRLQRLRVFTAHTEFGHVKLSVPGDGEGTCAASF